MTQRGLAILFIAVAALACGRVGPPVRASEREPEAAAAAPAQAAPQAPAPAEPEADAQETQP
jgi:hypothetical protein